VCVSFIVVATVSVTHTPALPVRDLTA
jgi:hypothetical protein